jgi:hypothetical protein
VSGRLRGDTSVSTSADTSSRQALSDTSTPAIRDGSRALAAAPSPGTLISLIPPAGGEAVERNADPLTQEEARALLPIMGREGDPDDTYYVTHPPGA